MLKQLLKKYIPHPLLSSAKRLIVYTPLDIKDFLTGQRDPLIPPRRKIFIGGPEYRAIGDSFFEIFQKYGGLNPASKVLDIGCGIGRMSRPMVDFLDPAQGGSYFGFDIDKNGVEWCQQKYVNYSNFQFERADIYNKYYNPKGTQQAEEFSFPAEANAFDFIFATSVFTHMSPISVKRYLSEIARVLKPQGKAVLTSFQWDEESKGLVQQGRSTIDFIEHGDLIVKDPLIPEDAIAIQREEWQAMLDEFDLHESEFHPGIWCGRNEGLSYQDIAVISKK